MELPTLYMEVEMVANPIPFMIILAVEVAANPIICILLLKQQRDM